MNKTASSSTKMLVEGAMMIAIATILSFLKITTPLWVNGGSITAASMVPILIFAYRWGGTKGIFVGAIYGTLQFIISPYAAHVASIVLDYPLAFGGIGAMGYIANKSSSDRTVFIGIAVGLLLRLLGHFLSGVIFFAEYAPEGMNPFVYSALYNGSFILPEILISCVVFKLLRKTVDAL